MSYITDGPREAPDCYDPEWDEDEAELSEEDRRQMDADVEYDRRR